MKVIQMKFNREPSWLTADEEIKRWKEENLPMMVRFIEEARDKSLLVKEQIIYAVETEGECQLSWDGASRPMHKSYARKWQEVLPQYDFEIRGFKCIVRKR